MSAPFDYKLMQRKSERHDLFSHVLGKVHNYYLALISQSLKYSFFNSESYSKLVLTYFAEFISYN